MSNQLHFTVDESSQVAEARRSITVLANSLGFNETETGKAAIAATEIATNLLKHAREGQLLARPLERAGLLGLEILSLDRGPGMANVSQALNDGYSTAGSPGTGLGAIARLSTVFDIHSLPGKGTALVAQLWKQDRLQAFTPPVIPDPANLVEIGAVYLAKPGEEVSGDHWAVKQRLDCFLIMVADGLGHGPEAQVASLAAVEVLAAKAASSPIAIVEAAHTALSHTRGAALAVVELELRQSVVRFAGVGNVAGVILGLSNNRHLTSYNGTVGHHVRKVQEFTYPWSPEAVLVLHSDGLTSHWDLNHYPGLIARHPSLIAGVLYRDFKRGNDDVTVLVIKQK
jgi:anti-sigma regulatory factor (Ser/Thr protein kinase)